MAKSKKKSTDRALVRYVVVGAGNIAQVAVLPAFKHAAENSLLVGIVSDDVEKRAALADEYGVEHVGDYDELERVLAESDADAAYIAVPNDLHRAFTERCARAGVHVLCEKPLAMTVPDCEAMIAVCADHSVKLMTAYRLHFEEGTLEAIEAVRSGALGDVRLFSSVFSHDVREGDIRTQRIRGGGALYDIGIYCVNAARSIFGAEPIEVFAWQAKGKDERFREVDEMTTAQLRFADDRVAQLVCNQGVGDVSSYRVVGTRGDLTVEPAYEYADVVKHRLTIGGKTKKRKFPRRDQFAPLLVELSRCIVEDDEPEPSGEEGLADVRVLEAIVESAARGEPVQLAPFEREQHPSLEQEMHKPPVTPPKPVNAPSPSR